MGTERAWALFLIHLLTGIAKHQHSNEKATIIPRCRVYKNGSMRASHRYIPTHERLVVFILLCVWTWRIRKQGWKQKNAFLISRIRMALRPLRPIDTANIIKNPNTPNNQPEKFDADFGFNDSSLIYGAWNNRPKRGKTFIYDKTKIGRDFTFRPNTTINFYREKYVSLWAISSKAPHIGKYLSKPKTHRGFSILLLSAAVSEV